MIPGLESVSELDFEPFSTAPGNGIRSRALIDSNLESDPRLESVPLIGLAPLDRKRRVPRLNNHYICIKIKSQSSIIC